MWKSLVLSALLLVPSLSQAQQPLPVLGLTMLEDTDWSAPGCQLTRQPLMPQLHFPQAPALYRLVIEAPTPAPWAVRMRLQCWDPAICALVSLNLAHNLLPQATALEREVVRVGGRQHQLRQFPTLYGDAQATHTLFALEASYEVVLRETEQRIMDAHEQWLHRTFPDPAPTPPAADAE